MELCDPHNHLAQMFLQIADHWKKGKWGLPSSVMALENVLVPFFKSGIELDYTSTMKLDGLVSYFYEDLEKDYNALKMQNDTLLEKVKSLRLTLESLREESPRLFDEERYSTAVLQMQPLLLELFFSFGSAFVDLMKLFVSKFQRFIDECSGL
jgi:hypothetical protein